MTTSTDTLAALYAALSIAEGKRSEQRATVAEKDLEADLARQILDGYIKDCRELHKLIAAKKKRPAKPSNVDPDMPVHLRRAGA